jgi:DNA-directed RNA polymerase subunit RPC12/RpoP
MDAHVEETAFLSFICPACHQEIEAPADMANQESECPACAAPITVPAVSAPGTLWSTHDAADKGPSQAQIDAMKSRTIRIELPDSW